MIKERVQQYCKYKNMGISRFGKLAGLSNGYFNAEHGIPGAAEESRRKKRPP